MSVTNYSSLLFSLVINLSKQFPSVEKDSKTKAYSLNQKEKDKNRSLENKKKNKKRRKKEKSVKEKEENKEGRKPAKSWQTMRLRKPKPHWIEKLLVRKG